MPKIPIEVSARHCHLNQQDLEKLFGRGYELKVLKNISQPGQYAAAEEVKIQGVKGELSLRIVGPIRKETQVELSITDCFKLGIKPVLKVSGNIKNTPGAVLIGPKGKVEIAKGVIVAQRHLHLSEAEAKALKLKNGQKVSLKINGPRGLVFHNVAVRCGAGHKKSFQLDTDEGNSCGWVKGMTGELVGK